MTRLTEGDLKGLDNQIRDYDKNLKKICGASLMEIAALAGDITTASFNEAMTKHTVGVIPITSGQGIIGNFSQSVKSFIDYLGFHAFVTNSHDVSGIAEAIARKASLIFMADDNQFIAVNLNAKKVVDNGEATGRGFAAALSLLAGGLKNRQVLVVGAGRVGTHCVNYLLAEGARVAVFDIDKNKISSLVPNITIEDNLSDAVSKYRYIIDASPEQGFMTLDNLHPETRISAPGMPLGLTADAFAAFEGKVIHDPLQIGVATMLAMAVNKS
ncbi:3-methylornithyl-N6-L-lysine dehydrogenase PylD [Desulfitibacter alkalitolerans]|uniref:3-methylornithyl-N6-L-lysine dehydrogenase PylD n=1 Tax=Desulfitibacter alkalitolerans TaxID=264641 RepID=UPI0004827DB2|nr:3-methylornithyl-N6-L-lysine dehydrogenase PylD [Desulfitibacter alkalitolerans]